MRIFTSTRCTGLRCATGLIAILTAACAPERSTGPLTDPIGPALSSTGGFKVSEQVMRTTLTRIARGLALGLRDPVLRRIVYDAIESSAFAEGKLHFRSFLEGAGAGLATAVARVEHRTAEAVLASLDSLIDLEMYLPVPSHRASWRGEDDLLVAAALRDHEVTAAFELDGTPVRLSPDDAPTTPALVVVPAETDFSHPPGPSPSIGLQLAAATSTATSGLYMTAVSVDDDHEGWLMGSPEFEFWVLGDSLERDERSRVKVDLAPISCAGRIAGPTASRFDQNGLTYSGNVLLVSGSALLARKNARDSVITEIQLWEHDTAGECGEEDGVPQAGGVTLNTIGGLVISGVAATGMVTVGIPPAHDPDAFMVWFAGGSFPLMLGDLLFGLNGDDDFVGRLRPPCSLASPWSSGQYSLHREDGVHGGVTLVNTMNDDAAIVECPPKVWISGPTNIVLDGGTTWTTWKAAVSQTSGTPTYEWRRNGVYVGNASQYAAPLSSATSFQLQLKVKSGPHTVTKYMSVQVHESNCPPSMLTCDA